MSTPITRSSPQEGRSFWKRRTGLVRLENETDGENEADGENEHYHAKKQTACKPAAVPLPHSYE